MLRTHYRLFAPLALACGCSSPPTFTLVDLSAARGPDGAIEVSGGIFNDGGDEIEVPCVHATWWNEAAVSPPAGQGGGAGAGQAGAGQAGAGQAGAGERVRTLVDAQQECYHDRISSGDTVPFTVRMRERRAGGQGDSIFVSIDGRYRSSSDELPVPLP